MSAKLLAALRVLPVINRKDIDDVDSMDSGRRNPEKVSAKMMCQGMFLR